MREELLRVIDPARPMAVDTELLKHYAHWMTEGQVRDLSWEDVEHLNIFGADDPRFAGRYPDTPAGYYASSDGKWVLSFQQSNAHARHAISRCGSKLKRLVIASIDLGELDVAGLTGLEFLSYRMFRSGFYCHVAGLEDCTELEDLNLSGVVVSGRVDVSKMHRLKRLYVRLSARRDRNDVYFTGLQQHEALEELSVYGSLRTSVLDVSGMPNLKKLRIRFNDTLCDVAGIETLHKLERIAFGRTGIRRLPEGIRKLKKLRRLNLSQQRLDTLPDWITELELPFRMHRGPDSDGIILRKAEILDMDMTIFDQPQEMIVQWFEARKAGNEVPLNEIKVVFLGDGEAGKSHTIARLLGDGGAPVDYTDKATPGIVIKNKTYSMDGRDIQVHYWDFGGQEILHSMHRIFLTERTLYVVLVNARDETQDARAKYWLHNIKSFAPKARVLLVLNKMDQNPNARFNEPDLRRRYENLTQIVKLSALKDDRDTFNREFTDVLMEEIRKTGYLDVTWPRHWTNVKRELEQMKTNYIRAPRYREICQTHGVEQNRNDLLNWFTDLGVSFCCSDDYRLENYVILRPDWITNALYIVLFNKCRGARNGLIPHRSIKWILSEEADRQEEIRRVMPRVYYDWDEIRYVLEVFHKSQLSFDAGNEREFIPMLCDPNSAPVAGEYELDEKTLEFQMEFEYLPNNLLYQLMVDRKDELQMAHVWRTGALFAQEETGFSAVVMIDDNKLRLFVRSEQQMHRPNTYLTMLKANVDRIWRRMGLQKPTNALVYKLGGKKDVFDYELLKFSASMGQTQMPSMALRQMIDICDILNQSAPEKVEKRDKLLEWVLRSCQNIQREMRYCGSDEDDRNNRLRDDLSMVGYVVNDQTRKGSSGSRRNPGELDIEVRTDEGRPWTIIEALRVDSGTKGDWNDHLKKLLDNYNAHGAPFVILLTYVDCMKDKFDGIWTSFEKHMKGRSTDRFTYVPESYERIDHVQLENNSFIRMAKCEYDGGGYRPTVYHIFVQIDK